MRLTKKACWISQWNKYHFLWDSQRACQFSQQNNYHLSRFMRACWQSQPNKYHLLWDLQQVPVEYHSQANTISKIYNEYLSIITEKYTPNLWFIMRACWSSQQNKYYLLWDFQWELVKYHGKQIPSPPKSTIRTCWLS